MSRAAAGAREQNTGRTAIFIIANGSCFMVPFVGSSINIALPDIARDFSLNAVMLSWMPTAYILAACMALVPLGRMADIYGRRRALVYGVLIYVAASVLALAAPNPLLLIMARVFQGIGGAMLYGTGMAALTGAFPAAQRGKVLGFNIGCVYSGMSLGPVLGGLLVEHFGWRSIFTVNLAMGVALAIAILWGLKTEWTEAKGERFDLPGAVIYSLSLLVWMYGVSLLPTAAGIWIVAAGLAGIAGFVVWETRVASPVLDIKLFRHNTAFVLSNVAALVNYSATYAVGFLLSLYLQYIKGLGPEAAGLILVAQPVVQAMLAPLSGRLSDRIEPRRVASFGMGVTAAGLAMLAFLNEATPVAYIVGSLVVLGFGFGCFSAPNTSAIMGSVEKRSLGIASGLVGTMRHIGQMVSLGTVMVLFTVYTGRVQITPQYYPQFLSAVRVAFIVFTALCLGGIFASLARGKMRQAEASRQPGKLEI